MSFRRHILMGHRLSKTPVHGCNASKLDECKNSQNRLQTSLQISEVLAAEEPIISVEIPNSTEVHTKFFDTSAIASTQIIIKIQLTKMEGQETTNTECNKNIVTDNAIACSPTNNNGQQVLSLNFNGNLSLNSELETSSDANCETSTRTSKFPCITTQHVSTGSPTFLVNNNFNPNVVIAPMSSNSQISENYNIAMGQMTDLEKRMSIASMVSSSSSNSEVAEGNTSDSGERVVRTAIALNNYKESRAHYRQDADVDSNEYCCRRKSKSTTFPSKWRCCKCTCRDAFKRIIDASSSKSSKKKERKEGSSSKTNRHTADHLVLWNPLQSKSTRLSNNSAMSFASSTSISSGVTSSDVIIPITSPQFVVVQCPPSSLVTLGRIDDNAIRLMTTELVPNMNSTSASTRILTTSKEATYPNKAVVATPVNSSTNTSPGVNLGCPIVVGPVVHSQVDYIHCLVPDLEKISKASFYWGKMDRYEAERLLEGKPEGTFLLRDSAQEEYLFSVTFRKYGRSLHARIEQSNHKFSFDCHDPCVFTAPTVTGLLEHYKDPACVMFFEPMLTIPLHRNTTFSLQQLCRATIVSHTNYDGINELELPSRLKSYLKEYHYKQKLRVKPFDEHFYSCI